MRTIWMTGPALLILCAFPVPVSAQAEVQRFVLAAGANFGGADRPQLRYAVSDAARFAAVLTDLGGVDPANVILLKEPKVRELIQAIDDLSRRVSEAGRRAGGGRTEVLVYYSGHADEKGLLLGDDRYWYQTLRDRLDEMPADVRIAVLDACASGAFTRLKGGKARKPFLVDESASTRGHAFLTSSAETEAAQESDHLGASYFTHYLVSGLRGAADVTADRRVTLNEAYQFAFNETLGKTAGSGGGAQHPSYEINLSGTGDVVITDMRQTTASIVLGELLDGRVFIRNAKQQLVVELYKSQGRRVEIALEAGEYEVRIQRPATAMLARSTIRDGQHRLDHRDHQRAYRARVRDQTSRLTRVSATLLADTTTDVGPTAPLVGASRCMVCGRRCAWLLLPHWPVRRVSLEARDDHARAARRDSATLLRRALEGRHHRRPTRRPS